MVTLYINAYNKNVENVNVGLKMPKECFDWFLEYIVTGRYAEPYIRSLLNFTVHLNSTILNIINLDLLHIS